MSEMGVANSLVDQIGDGCQCFQGILLGGRLRLLLAENANGFLGEHDGTVAVCLEVDTNVELARSVVKVLDTSGSENHRELEVLLNVCGAGSVCVRGLDDADAEVVLQAS